MWATILISSVCFGAFSIFGIHSASKVKRDKENREKEKRKEAE